MGALDTSLLAGIRGNGLDSKTAGKGRPYLVGHKTATATLNPQDCYGGVVTNQGATGTIALTLPKAVVGMRITAVVMATQVLQLDPNTSTEFGVANVDQMNINGVLDATAGDLVSADAIGEFITLECIEPNVWTATSQAGTWTAA